jgi:hypothetical protein
MDENELRSLLERVADVDAPPSSVDIGQARRTGLWHRRLRRLGAAAASASAVAVVVGLVASGALPGIGVSGRSAPGTNGQTTHVRPPRPPFNPLVPYATLGWLPEGYSLAQPNNGDSLMGRDEEQIDAVSGPANITVMVFAPGHCRLTGMRSGQTRHRGRAICGRLNDPFELGPVPVSGPIPGVLGGHAYWWGHPGQEHPGLIFRAAKAWVDIEPAIITRAALIRIAAHVTFGTARPLAFPFRLTGLPSWWRVGQSENVGALGGRLVGTALFIGPAPHYFQVDVGTALATMFHSCGRDSGWQWVTVRGRRGILRTVYGNDHFQELCFGNVDGLMVNVTVNAPRSFTGRPLAVATAPGGVIDVFLHHLRLLGPDPANWTTHPVSH